MAISYTVPDILKKSNWERDGKPKQKLPERLRSTGIGAALKAYEELAAKGLGKLVEGATAGNHAAKALLKKLLEAVKTSEDKSKGNGPYLEHLSKIKIAVRSEATRIANTLAPLNAQSIGQDENLKAEFMRWAKTKVRHPSGRAAGMGQANRQAQNLLNGEYLQQFRDACKFSVG
jgi:hypothetical protein